MTVAVNPPVSVIPSRRNVLKPGSVKVTAYAPGPEVDDVVAPLAVGGRGADLLDQRRTRGLDGDAGQHPAGRISDDARDAARLLGERGMREEQEDQDDDADSQHQNLLRRVRYAEPAGRPALRT